MILVKTTSKLVRLTIYLEKLFSIHQEDFLFHHKYTKIWCISFEGADHANSASLGSKRRKDTKPFQGWVISTNLAR